LFVAQHRLYIFVRFNRNAGLQLRAARPQYGREIIQFVCRKSHVMGDYFVQQTIRELAFALGAPSSWA
jgi:hypothetical protein